MATHGTISPVGIEKLPSGKYRGVVRHDGHKAATRAVATRSEAVMLEAQLKLSMGGVPRPIERLASRSDE
jgi:hypothetical protein